MSLLNGFKPEEHQPRNYVLPMGLFDAVFTEYQEKPTKAGTGKYAQLDGVLLDGTNRPFTERLNLDNPNPDAVRIANETLAKLCRAIGITASELSGPADILNKQFKVKVTHRQGKGGELEHKLNYVSRQEAQSAIQPTTTAPQAPVQW